jgi:hypothetical protein
LKMNAWLKLSRLPAHGCQSILKDIAAKGRNIATFKIARKDRLFRRFPNPGWAWPSGPTDQLICAAICPDRDRALGTFRQWICNQKVEETEFREQRLLAAVAHRFGRELADLPQYGDLVKLQRQLWTTSSMSVATATPVLRRLEGAGIVPMLIKGGARIALRSDEQLARVSYDLDVVVKPGDFAEAVELLFEEGWSYVRGESRLRIAPRIRNIRSLNFFKGQFGDVDLHQWAFRSAAPDLELEDDLWKKSQKAEFFGVTVLVPCPSDRIALAIGHSGRESHDHSDWLVDCARFLMENSMDWDRLAKTLDRTGSAVPAQCAFSYLERHLGCSIPSDFMAQLFDHPGSSYLSRVSSVLRAKPRTDWNLASMAGRGVALAIDRRREKKAAGTGPTIVGRVTTHAIKGGISHTPAQEKVQLFKIDDQRNHHCQFKLEVEIDRPGTARSIEFELNTDARHLVGLRARTFWPRSGVAILRFSGSLDLLVEDQSIWLEARPSRHLRGNETQEFADRYKPLAVRAHFFRIEPPLDG